MFKPSERRYHEAEESKISKDMMHETTNRRLTSSQWQLEVCRSLSADLRRNEGDLPVKNAKEYKSEVPVNHQHVREMTHRFRQQAESPVCLVSI